MDQAYFTSRVKDTSVSREERLLLIAQFVYMNQFALPLDLLSGDALPEGYVFRAWVYGDIALLLAVREEEARLNPSRAEPDSAQVLRFRTGKRGDILPGKVRIVATLNGSVTKVTQIEDAEALDSILDEWAAAPPTEEETAPSEQAPPTVLN